MSTADGSGCWVVRYPQQHDCRLPSKWRTYTRQFGVADKWKCGICDQIWRYSYHDAVFRPRPCYEWHRDLPYRAEDGTQWDHPHNDAFSATYEPESADPDWQIEGLGYVSMWSDTYRYADWVNKVTGERKPVRGSRHVPPAAAHLAAGGGS